MKSSKGLILTGLVALLWIYSSAHFWRTGMGVAVDNYYGDFLANFPAGAVAEWVGRSDMFEESLSSRWVPMPRWGYGPALHVVTLPLFLFPNLKSAYFLWLGVNYLMILIAAIALYRATRPRETSLLYVTLFGFIMLNFYPLYEGLAQRVIEIFELMLICIAMAAWGRARERTAGISIGIAAMTKFTPAAFWLWFLLRRRWPAAIACGLTMLAFAIPAELLLGWENNWVVVQLGRGSWLQHMGNMTIGGAVMRLFALNEWPNRQLAARVVTLCFALALGAYLAFRQEREGDWKLEWSLLSIAMVVLLPHGHNYYLLFLVIPAAVLLQYAFDGRLGRWAMASGLTGYLLVAWPFPLGAVNRLIGGDSVRWMLNNRVPVIGALLLALALILEMNAAGKR
ncbi:MAG TPA: glycosyltransferase family 87 protein [Thermoanaerobaculia bacterium]|nr:glycosyltransferase family 87 protein [Thermoanaerobaculia bacterium]